MKIKVQVQFNKVDVDTLDLQKLAKEDLKAMNIKMNTIETLEVYYKPENYEVYYVATLKNGETIRNKKPLTVK